MKRLAELRKSHNLSQKELAEILNSSQNTISNWETGKREPDFETTIMIANYFCVTTDYLLGKNDFNALPKESDNQRFNEDENQLIKKYRQLDQRGQQAVLDTLNREYSYISNDDIDLASITADAVKTIDMLERDLPINQFNHMSKK